MSKMRGRLEILNKKFTAWYLHGGGFCPECGEGLGVVTDEQIKLFGKCPFEGEHQTKMRGGV